jgi:hypothetical protein
MGFVGGGSGGGGCFERDSMGFGALLLLLCDGVGLVMYPPKLGRGRLLVKRVACQNVGSDGSEVGDCWRHIEVVTSYDRGQGAEVSCP